MSTYNDKKLMNISFRIYLMLLIVPTRFIRLPKKLDFFNISNVYVVIVILVFVGIIISIVMLYKGIGIVFNINKKDNDFSSLSEKLMVYITMILQDVH